MSNPKALDEIELLIIRRNGSQQMEPAKAGGWKIAYADFMTAMMAFFLVMWLINVTSDTTKTGVANYFNPIRLADRMMSPQRGIHDPEAAQSEKEGAEDSDEPAGAKSAVSDSPKAASSSDTSEQSAGNAQLRDPYAVLATIADEADGATSLVGGAPSASPGGTGEIDRPGNELYRDPFDPVTWNTPAVSAAAQSGSEPPVEPEHPRDESAPRPSAPDETKDLAGAETARTEAGEVALASAGGVPTKPDTSHDAQGSSELASAASKLQAELENAVNNAASSARMPDVSVQLTPGGVLISLADQADFGMFAIGSADPLPETRAAMEKIATLLKTVPGHIIIRGHTDGRPFRAESYDNWQLSTARAYIAYRLLVSGGFDETRVERIEGYADRDLKLPGDPEAAENRRIDILVREVRS